MDKVRQKIVDKLNNADEFTYTSEEIMYILTEWTATHSKSTVQSLSLESIRGVVIFSEVKLDKTKKRQ